jgi:hypothetical protein
MRPRAKAAGIQAMAQSKAHKGIMFNTTLILMKDRKIVNNSKTSIKGINFRKIMDITNINHNTIGNRTIRKLSCMRVLNMVIIIMGGIIQMRMEAKLANIILMRKLLIIIGRMLSNIL